MLNICSKIVYGEFCPYKSTLPTAEAKWEGKYPSLSGERTKMYFLPFQVSLDTKLRAFQYKLNRIVYTSHMINYRLSNLLIPRPALSVKLKCNPQKAYFTFAK